MIRLLLVLALALSFVFYFSFNKEIMDTSTAIDLSLLKQASKTVNTELSAAIREKTETKSYAAASTVVQSIYQQVDGKFSKEWFPDFRLVEYDGAVLLAEQFALLDKQLKFWPLFEHVMGGEYYLAANNNLIYHFSFEDMSLSEYPVPITQFINELAINYENGIYYFDDDLLYARKGRQEATKSNSIWIEQLISKDSEQRTKAAEYLIAHPNEAPVGELIGLLPNPDSSIRELIIRIVAQLAHSDDIPTLLQYSNDDEAYVRRAIYQAIYQIGLNAGFQEQLISKLELEPNKQAKAALIFAIAEICDQTGFASIAQFSDDPMFKSSVLKAKNRLKI